MGTSPARVAPLAIGLIAILGALASCTSSGAHIQSPSPSTTSSSPTSSTSQSTAPSATPSPTASWTPPAYGDAAPAVTAYLNLIAQYDQAFRDPAHSSAATFDQDVVGNAKTLFDGSLFDEKRAGRYYKGTPPQQRVRVTSSNLNTRPASVNLRSCPLENPTDPWQEYEATGKVVPPTLVKGVAPPYGKTIRLIKLDGKWQVSEFATNATKTCTP